MVNCALDAVAHIHHWQSGVLGKEAIIMAMSDGVVEDVNSIVGRTAAWRSISAENARVTSRSEIYAKLFAVVLWSQ
jgi:hypothetical protein